MRPLDSIRLAEGWLMGNRKRSFDLTLKALCLAIGLASSGLSGAATSDDALSSEFDSQFLRGLGQNVDLSRYTQPGTVIAGDYELDVLINRRDMLRQTVHVVDGDGPGEQHFCFSAADVQRWGVRVDQLPDQQQAQRVLASDCIEAETLIPGASFSLDMASLRGDLSIPQAYAGTVRRGYVDPAEWDDGINAMILGYHANVFHSKPDSSEESTDYNVNLNAGVNLAGWRLRHNGNYHYNDTDEVSEYAAQNTYARTDVDRWRAQLTLGEYFTPGSEFESIPFTGVQLGSDDSMLPESERGYAPVIRGTANTNARVTVSQDGHVVYETSVSAGAFVIDDLYATGYAGDLEVTVSEADGSERSFTVPYASVVQMLRPGSSRFNVVVGRYRDDEMHDEPSFAQATWRRGINNRLTLYAGGLVAKDYDALLMGTAVGTPLGAVAIDATLTRAEGIPYEHSELNGQSYRLSYSKMLNATGTNFSLAAYRFSSEEYVTFADFAHLKEGDASSDSLRERNRFQLSISQSLGELGNLNLSGLTHDYWNGRPDQTTYQLDYSKGFHWGSLSLSATRDLEEDDESNTYMLTASIPLGDGNNHPMLSATATFDDDHSSTMRTNLSGTAGDERQLSYNAYVSRADNDINTSTSFGGDLNYRTSATQLGTTYSHGDGYEQYSASATGIAVVHSGGVVFSPDRAETMALIHADGAVGASLSNGMGNRLDRDGEALDAGLTPYRHNSIAISPRGLPMDVELKSTSQTVTPRRGAVVRVDYKTRVGHPMLVHVDNDGVPFAAEVVDGNGQHVSLVGQGRMIFLRGEYPELQLKWGEGFDQSCRLQFPASQQSNDISTAGYQQVEALCTPL